MQKWRLNFSASRRWIFFQIEMKRLLLRPTVQVAFTAFGVISAALLTGLPLILKSTPPWIYIILLAALITCQIGPLTTFFVAQRVLVSRLRVAGEEAIRSLIAASIAADPIHGNGETEVNWAVCIRDVGGRTLLSRRTDAFRKLNFPALDPSSTRVKALAVQPLPTQPCTNRQLFGGCRTQTGTGFRFEVFYEVPNSISVREGSILGSNLLEVLTNDHMVGFIANRLALD